MNDKLREIIFSRAISICKNLPEITGPGKFWIGGGCLAGREIRDIDMFKPIGNNKITFKDEPRIIVKTPNAITYEHVPPLQVCNYDKNNLEELVNSFDFAHIQVGAEIVIGDNNKYIVNAVFFTDDFVEANAGLTTWFCGTEYPLSSLLRAGKYYKYDIMKRGTYIGTVLSTMSSMLERGFEDYEDFKKQLDAVDLGLVPAELEDTENDALITIYNCLTKERKIE